MPVSGAWKPRSHGSHAKRASDAVAAAVPAGHGTQALAPLS